MGGNGIIMDILTLFNIATAIVRAASIVCAATPTPKDDAFLAKYIYPVVELLGLQVGKAKD